MVKGSHAPFYPCAVHAEDGPRTETDHRWELAVNVAVAWVLEEIVGKDFLCWLSFQWNRSALTIIWFFTEFVACGSAHLPECHVNRQVVQRSPRLIWLRVM